MPDDVDHRRDTAECEVRARLAAHVRTAALAGAPFAPVTGGFSNFAWRAGGRATDWCVRLGRAGTERLGADPVDECRILRVVAAAGLAPPVLHCDAEARLLVTRWVCEPSPPTRAEAGAHLGRLAPLLAVLHGLPVPADLRRVDFAAQARALEDATPGGPGQRLGAIAVAVFRELGREPGPSVLCHNDLSPENKIEDAAGRLWLVDWEYAGLGEAVFDLASCASQHQLTQSESQELLELYRIAGGICADERFWWARWAFDYVQWLWYRAFRSHGNAAERQLADARAARLAITLLERASSLPHCNN